MPKGNKAKVYNAKQISQLKDEQKRAVTLAKNKLKMAEKVLAYYADAHNWASLFKDPVKRTSTIDFGASAVKLLDALDDMHNCSVQNRKCELCDMIVSSYLKR